MSAMLTADWFLFGSDTYYRKFEIYSLESEWMDQVDVDSAALCAASFGGPIAVIKEKKKMAYISKPVIHIFSSSGVKISSIVWDLGTLIAMGWSNREELLCVQNDGSVISFDLFGKYQHKFEVGHSHKVKVLDAKIFSSRQGTGVAIITTSCKVYLVQNVYNPKDRHMGEFSKASKYEISPKCWVVIPEERQTSVLVVINSEIYKLRENEPCVLIETFKVFHAFKYILSMEVSLNGKLIALFDDGGYISVGNADFTGTFREIKTDCIGCISQMIWCEDEAVVAHWDTTLIVAGIMGELVSYTNDSNVHLAEEKDGVRVISATQHEMIQKVPSVVQKIFRINSTEPGSFLLEASKQFQKRSHRADEFICLVGNELGVGVDQCINAAGFEFNIATQKMLIKAVQFGKCFIPNHNPAKYVQMCKTLRVLNAIRDPKIGIPLTFTQFHDFTPMVLLDRLVNRKLYFMAIEIAKHLNIPQKDGVSRILASWAKYKVSQTHLDTEIVAADIASKLGNTPGVSYSEIAEKAKDCGRKPLAIKLLDYEPRANLQVPLLLKLGEKDTALLKAIESGDTDLIYKVIFDLQKISPLEFTMDIRKYPVALALYKKYCKEHNPAALMEVYLQEDDFNAQAFSLLGEMLSKDDVRSLSTRESAYAEIQELFKKGKNDLNASICEEYQRLIKFQKSLEDKMQWQCLGFTVNETLQLLLERDSKMAEKFKSDFKIPDNRYWWFRIRSLAAKDDWVELDKFSKLKKSPIGYAPFVDVCLEYNNQREAVKYLPRVSEELKVKYYMRAEKFQDAAQIAFEHKDLPLLLEIQRKCVNNQLVVDKVNFFISQLRTKK